MLNSLLKESYIYGNFEIVYNLKEIKNIDYSILEKTNNQLNLIEGWQWRFYKNFKHILITREYDIINDKKKFKNFMIFLKSTIDTYEKKINIQDRFLLLDNLDEKKYFLIVVYTLIKEIEFRFISYDENLKNSKLYSSFNELFSNYTTFIRNKIINLDYVSPFEQNSWTSSWKFIYDDEEIRINNVDIYNDIYFYNYNIYYNNTMKENIIVLSRRLKYINENAKEYYKKAIEKNLYKLTEKIFNSFPLQNVFINYKSILEIKDINVFRPPLYEKAMIDENVWSLCVLPDYLMSYILGFPIITSDTPAAKNLIPFISKFSNSYKEYYKFISSLNKKKLELISFGVPCGNNTDEDEDLIDLTFSKVIDYNMDDFIIIFNNGVYHCFTSPEFKELVKKEINPYNRSKIPVFNNIVENMRFKKKTKRQLANRFLEIDLEKTLIEIFEEIKEKIKIEINTDNVFETSHNSMEIFSNPLINYLMGGNYDNFGYQ